MTCKDYNNVVSMSESNNLKVPEWILKEIDKEKQDAKSLKGLMESYFRDEFCDKNFSRYKLLGVSSTRCLIAVAVWYCYRFAIYDSNSHTKTFFNEDLPPELHKTGGTVDIDTLYGMERACFHHFSIFTLILCIARNVLYVRKRKKLKSLIDDIESYLDSIDSNIEYDRIKNENKLNENSNDSENKNKIEWIESLNKENMNGLRKWQSLLGSCSGYFDNLTSFAFVFFCASAYESIVSLRTTDIKEILPALTDSQELADFVDKYRLTVDLTNSQSIISNENSSSSNNNSNNDISNSNSGEEMQSPAMMEKANNYDPSSRNSPFSGPGMTGFDPLLLTDEDVQPLDNAKNYEISKAKDEIVGMVGKHFEIVSLFSLYGPGISCAIFTKGSLLPLNLAACLYIWKSNTSHQVCTHECGLMKYHCRIISTAMTVLNLIKIATSKGYYYQVSQHIEDARQLGLRVHTNENDNENEDEDEKEDHEKYDEKQAAPKFNNKKRKFLENSRFRGYITNDIVNCLPWILFGFCGYVSSIAVLASKSSAPTIISRKRADMKEQVERSHGFLSMWKSITTTRAVKIFKLAAMSSMLLGVCLVIGNESLQNRGKYMLANFGEKDDDIEDEIKDDIDQEVARALASGDNGLQLNIDAVEDIRLQIEHLKRNESIADDGKREFKDEESDNGGEQLKNHVVNETENEIEIEKKDVRRFALYSKTDVFEMRHAVCDSIAAFFVWCEDELVNSFFV